MIPHHFFEKRVKKNPDPRHPLSSGKNSCLIGLNPPSRWPCGLVFEKIILTACGGSGIFPKNLDCGAGQLHCPRTADGGESSRRRIKQWVMTWTINTNKVWWTLAKYTLAALFVMFLISRGLHPVWAILLVIYRKAALRICLFLGALYWLTQSIL